MFDNVLSGRGTTLTGCWSDLLLAVASKPEAVSHVVSIRAGLTGMSSEVRSPFSGVLVFLHVLCTCSYNIMHVYECACEYCSKSHMRLEGVQITEAPI